MASSCCCVQGDLLSRLTAARPPAPSVSNGADGSVCILSANNGIPGASGGSVAVRLVSQQPTTVSSLMPGMFPLVAITCFCTDGLFLVSDRMEELWMKFDSLTSSIERKELKVKVGKTQVSVIDGVE